MRAPAKRPQIRRHRTQHRDGRELARRHGGAEQPDHVVANGAGPVGENGLVGNVLEERQRVGHARGAALKLERHVHDPRLGLARAVEESGSGQLGVRFVGVAAAAVAARMHRGTVRSRPQNGIVVLVFDELFGDPAEGAVAVAQKIKERELEAGTLFQIRIFRVLLSLRSLLLTLKSAIV